MQFHNFPLIIEIYFPHDHKKCCLSFVLMFELNISSQKCNLLASIFKESIRLHSVSHITFSLGKQTHCIYLRKGDVIWIITGIVTLPHEDFRTNLGQSIINYINQK